MTSYELAIKYIESGHEFVIFKDLNNGLELTHNFCYTIRCSNCKIQNECNKISPKLRPALSLDEITELSKIYPEYFI